MVAAFGDGMDLGWATTIVSNLRKEGIVAIDKESSEIVGCNFLSPSAGGLLPSLHTPPSELTDDKMYWCSSPVVSR